eukprot:659004-Alexandrium_andersonii.AAC.1
MPCCLLSLLSLRVADLGGLPPRAGGAGWSGTMGWKVRRLPSLALVGFGLSCFCRFLLPTGPPAPWIDS